MPECYTTLGYLAAITERIELGAMVRSRLPPPGLLIKSVTTLDSLPT
jgi:alkanesulfonate monooxygenase SsuD/methylene tetrahydromethanopterin reductase-like flavin-dependent oxidoreductase (luciferase family)